MFLQRYQARHHPAYSCFRFLIFRFSLTELNMCPKIRFLNVGNKLKMELAVKSMVNSISSYWSLSIPPENIFRGYQKRPVT